MDFDYEVNGMRANGQGKIKMNSFRHQQNILWRDQKKSLEGSKKFFLWEIKKI